MSDPDFLARETLRLIGPDPENWVPDRPGIDHNVVVVGGGHAGSTFAFALRRAGIGKVAVIDTAADEAEAGIWRSTARMQRLRTPKSLPGPELGHVGLGVQAWYEARHGQEAWAAIDRIARTDWVEYLAWYRRTLGITLRTATRLERIEPASDHFRLHLTVAGTPRVETARKVVLATGFLGAGGAYVPSEFAQLPATHLAHTSGRIDFAALAGRTVAVVGAAASAFDAAAVALEAGAASVHLFSRRARLAALPVIKPRLYPGAYDHYPALPDALRWRQARRFREAGSTAPADAIARVTRFANFHLHLGAAWDGTAVVGETVEAYVGGTTHRFDFVIAGTGYFVDPAVRPELRDFAGDILLWRDRYTPPPEEADAALGRYPYLDPALAYQEKQPGAAPFLRDIHAFNPSGFLSHGLPIGDVPSFRRDIPAVVARIGRDLFLADLAQHERRIEAEVTPDFDETLYAGAVRTPARIAAE
ncbi:SidA/IucD/PvdA family monooxygenase [Rhodovastum atsumiense]|uniref:SidA/IucD/PvdA family monooxygenase n=1 Tax=Rhodovastum atsumiense TaxID=504468 RepID=A0A5M6J191_9PROT|nr:NAD(P)-binding domain-containing protein [Rhodovastum atsumiense]KAA5613837.1 SidA/IucD/PvdA family monooxygenase [Rhodovastum atsumiense]CAH2601947.1 SidA/IucD/PvdA family monooxygenase [Rhodovastum atsumiense]